MNKNRKRPQAQKPHRHANPEMAAAMRDLRSSNAAQPHKLKNREDRQVFRKQRQRGEW